MQKQVGVGQTAAVWAARVHDSGATVAVKVFNLAYLKGDKVSHGPSCLVTAAWAEEVSGLMP